MRPTNFDKIEQGDGANGYATEEVEMNFDGIQGEWKNNVVSESDMADLATSKYVISGGRGLKNGENFQLLYDFAVALSG